MKTSKIFKHYLVIWAALLVLFHIIAFVSAGWEGQEKYTASFWIGYGFILLCFIGQLACAHKALNEENRAKLFYNLSLFQASYSGLIASFIFGGLCMLISPLPYWVGVILCAVVLAINVMAVAKASAAVEAVAQIDKKIKTQTFFIKSLTVDAETLMARAQSQPIREECRKVYEAIRYSDPMSNDALANVESQITVTFSKLIQAVTEDNAEAAKGLSNELIILVNDRNNKCKLLK